MFGEGARAMLLTLGEAYPGFLLAVLPPGAFIGLGLLIAIKNHIDKHIASKQHAVAATESPYETQAT
jgi:electron transport complex protein RnfE